MVAFVFSLLLMIVMIGICLAAGKRRPPGAPFTWGEAFVAGTWVFAIMMLAYGVVPHQWLTFADNDLLWRADKLMVGISSGGVEWGDAAKDMSGSGRILVNYQAVRDIIAAVLYIVFLGGQVVLWSVWQKRGRTRPEVEVASAFGRPVVRKA